MVFGGAGAASLQINDAAVWSGTPCGPAAARRVSDASAHP
jgi:hypothetical protein